MPTPATVPALRVAPLLSGLRLDGRMDEAMWATADSIGSLTEVEPVAGQVPAGRTVVRILADAGRIVIGVRADDPDPGRIVSFARERDNALTNEDHIKIVLDTYLDGRSGYVFAVNPNGARYDALISGQGDVENANWDAVWDAATVRTSTGWSAEIVIPVRSLQFARGLSTWGFNIQRRVQRLLENDRWASPVRDFKITQTFRAGRLTDLPPFALGIGLSVRPAETGSSSVPAPGATRSDAHDFSLDATQTLGASTLAALTVNTDFAETEVDTRRTNLTRFPIVFPEKRTFFLQGSDIFDFGLGLGDDVRPFFSRRIGLLNGDEVPIRVGAKITGREGGANFGGLGVRTREIAAPAGTSLVSTANTLGVMRYKQNLGRESSVGMIGSAGDPIGRTDSWMAGVDANFQTSRFRVNKNLLLGAWGVQTDRAGLTGDKTAWGARIAYPNDLWNLSATFKRIGDGFDPSLGFVPRRAVQIIEITSNYLPRPRERVAGLRVRQMVHEFQPRIVTDLSGTWESYRIFMAPVNWRLESGDRFEINANPTGERLVAPFTIAPGVTIPAGAYHWMRYRLEGGFAQKRRLSGQATWWFGSFYTGTLNEIILTSAWKPSSLFNLELNATRNVGQLRPGGHPKSPTCGHPKLPQLA
ncbi:MAG: carbohydrate binding family 9 domain-containing protein [Gemmatimonadaceae bacterium]|nr:carbohydrate binding family 9 domain-containing protein [Gemmatimonadaceae bacterium]